MTTSLKADRNLGGILGRNPEETLREIVESGLRGRGGAGFPPERSGSLQGMPRRAQGRDLQCDEGDPGAYMDRTISKAIPIRSLKAWLSAPMRSAPRGIIYVRAEYLWRVRVLKGHAGRSGLGLSGKNILARISISMFLFFRVRAFVCVKKLP